MLRWTKRNDLCPQSASEIHPQHSAGKLQQDEFSRGGASRVAAPGAAPDRKPAKKITRRAPPRGRSLWCVSRWQLVDARVIRGTFTFRSRVCNFINLRFR
jgi:hypothetical protein